MPSCTVFGLKQEEVDVMKKEGLKVRLVCDCHHAVWCMTLSCIYFLYFQLADENRNIEGIEVHGASAFKVSRHL